MKDSKATPFPGPSAADRSFPLDTISALRFRLRHELDAGEVTLHTGPFADELARSFSALAVTFAADIYFRTGAYNPASKEGERLLAHELTHAAQYTEKRITPMSRREELEAEAWRAEDEAMEDSDPRLSLLSGGEIFSLRKSSVPAAAKGIAGEINAWLREQKDSCDDEDYLRLLCALEKWLGDQ